MCPDDEKYGEYLAYLYETAERKYGGDVDELVSESIYAFWLYEKSGRKIEHPKGLLDAILKNKWSDRMREKYKRGVSELDVESIGGEAAVVPGSDGGTREEEYAAVRREVGRLLKIYREVVVRHYMHGESVEQIAKELDLPKGTVLSRLSSARRQIREGLEKMEKYASFSYEPKTAAIAISGSDGMDHEPFSLLSSPIEPNILICAYERPVSLRGLSDTLGMPAAYIEPIAEKLVKNELLGRTPSGLVYTRCFVENYEDSFGDIAFAEELAERNAQAFSEMTARAAARYEDCPSYRRMNEKQKATILLIHAFRQLKHAAFKARRGARVLPEALPERPNGGRWLATLSYFERGQGRNLRYGCSGPLTVSYRSPEKPSAHCLMIDCQTCFGDAHWGYARLGRTYSPGSILRFYASFLPTGVKTDRKDLSDRVPDFEKMHILRRNEDGETVLDIPAFTFAEAKRYCQPITAELQKEIDGAFGKELPALWERGKCRVPPHVDCAEACRHSNIANTYAIAQMRASVEKGLFPYEVEIGKTPLIYIEYEEE